MKDIEVHLTQAQIQEIYAELPADEIELPAQAIEVDEAELPVRFRGRGEVELWDEGPRLKTPSRPR